jgi:acyl-CoA thioesterase YciA
MDLAGGTYAAHQAKGRVATVSIEAMRFLRPVEVGDEVSCYCTLEQQGGTSVTVKIETWARDRTGRDPEKVTEGVFTYVALDKDGKPRELR